MQVDHLGLIAHGTFYLVQDNIAQSFNISSDPWYETPILVWALRIVPCMPIHHITSLSLGRLEIRGRMRGTMTRNKGTSNEVWR